MEIWSEPPVEGRALFAAERSELLGLLSELAPSAWSAPTAAAGWDVKDVALHLLDGDLGRLSRDRDGDLTGLLRVDDPARLAEALSLKNQRWVDAARHLSARVVRELLAESTDEVQRWTEGLDLLQRARVSWASDAEVPTWLDLAREFTETWVHSQQVREAVGLPVSTTRLPAVLGVFVWAFPHQYRAQAQPGTTVEVGLGTAGRWHLVCVGPARWVLEPGAAPAPSASAEFTADAAWRSLTGAAVPPGSVLRTGPDHLTVPLLAVRGIIA